MKKISVFVLALLASLSLSAVTSREILDAVDEKMSFDCAVFSATLVNRDRFGETKISFDTYEKGDGDTLLIVTSGSDRGQKILRLGDEIYIYYPGADETVRLSSSGLKDSFLGSDFSYEDLTGDDDWDARYSHSLDGEEEIDGASCYVLSLEAKNRSETYQKEKIYVDKERMVPLKMDLYSRSGKLLKEVYYSSYITDGGIYFPGKVEIVNAVKKNSSSLMTIDEMVFNSSIDEAYFDSEELSW